MLKCRSLARKLRRASPVLAAAAFLLGCLGLIGWAFDVRVLLGAAPELRSMRANTAVGLMLGGAALWLASTGDEAARPRRGALVLGGAMLMLGVLTLLEYAGGQGAGVDLLLFPDAQIRAGGAYPGRMSPCSAAVVALLGGALLVFDFETKGDWQPVDVLAPAGVVGAWIGLLGEAYGAQPLAMGGGGRAGMALHSAAGFLSIGLGLLFARPERGIMRLVTGDSAGSVLARSLLPVSLAVPFVIGLVMVGVARWLRIADLHLGAAVMVTLTMVAFTVLVYGAARTLDRADAQRRAAETEAAEERVRGEGMLAAAMEEREQLIAELRRALAIRDEFLSIAAHELRTPLSALALQLEALRRGFVKGGNDADRGRVLRKIQTSVQQTERLNVLVQSLLDVSRIGAGKLTLDIEEVDMTAIVQDVARRMADEASRQGSAIHVHAPPGVVGFWDRSRLEQALTNLLANALKYGAGRPVEVALSAASDEVALRVIDQGIGIGKEDLDRIFGMFERAAPADHYGGLGLGLYIAKQIALAHGGTIEVESQPGGDTVFTIRLPRRAPGTPAGG